MKAIFYTEYGPPSVLHVVDLEKPSPREKDVLVRVHASTVTSTDCIFRRGDSLFVRGFTGLRKPKHNVPGDTLAGVVESVGSAVTRFKPGDEVFGSGHQGFGAQAQYVLVPEDATLARKPANLSYGEAAAICDGALTALPFLRDTGEVRPGHCVLINGASGGIGTFAVQLAKHFGAVVTGVCSGANVALVQQLGADHVVDYHTADFTATHEAYDIIFDTVGKSSFTRCKPCLKPGGVFLQAAFSPATFPRVLWTRAFGSKKLRIAATGLRRPAERVKDLDFLRELAEAGKLLSVVGKTFAMDEIQSAHEYVETGHKRGNAVVQFV